jgi:hypothetical protein
MSAIGISGASPFVRRPRIIAAHADYRRSDFIFQRTQSLTMRDTPWAKRSRPLRSWSEISMYGAAAAIAATALVTALI